MKVDLKYVSKAVLIESLISMAESKAVILDSCTSYIKKTCPNCGMFVLIPSSLYERRLEPNRSFYCASGHSFYYGKSR